MRFVILASGLALAAMTAGASAQVQVQDNVAIGISNDTKRMTDKIMGDTAQILVQTTKTLQAITGDRSSDSNRFSSAALGGGYSMGQAPQLGQLAQAGASLFGGLSGGQQNSVAQIINGLNLVASLVNLVSGQQNTPTNQQYQQGVKQVTALTGVVQAMSSATSDRTQRIQGMQSQIGQAQDLKGSLDQNTQWMNQNALVLNENVGLSNMLVNQINEQDKANLLLISQLARALKVPENISSKNNTRQASELQALQDSARGN